MNAGYKKEEAKSFSTAKKSDGFSDMSPEEHFVSMHGDYGQAERLVLAKKSNQSSPSSPINPRTPGVSTTSISNSSVGYRAVSQTPNKNVKAKPANIFIKSAVRNITPGSLRPYTRNSPAFK